MVGFVYFQVVSPETRVFVSPMRTLIAAERRHRQTKHRRQWCGTSVGHLHLHSMPKPYQSLAASLMPGYAPICIRKKPLTGFVLLAALVYVLRLLTSGGYS